MRGSFAVRAAAAALAGATIAALAGAGSALATTPTPVTIKVITSSPAGGTFTANVQAHLIFGAPTDSFTWNILSGTGAYTNLHGSGNGVGDQLPTEIVDHFTGAVHFD